MVNHEGIKRRKGIKIVMARKKKQARKDLKKVENRLNKPKYAEKVVRNVQLKRESKTIIKQIARLENALKNAKGPERERIMKLIGILKKTQEIGKTAFYQK